MSGPPLARVLQSFKLTSAQRPFRASSETRQCPSCKSLRAHARHSNWCSTSDSAQSFLFPCLFRTDASDYCVRKNLGPGPSSTPQSTSHHIMSATLDEAEIEGFF